MVDRYKFGISNTRWHCALAPIFLSPRSLRYSSITIKMAGIPCLVHPYIEVKMARYCCIWSVLNVPRQDRSLIEIIIMMISWYLLVYHNITCMTLDSNHMHIPIYIWPVCDCIVLQKLSYQGFFMLFHYTSWSNKVGIKPQILFQFFSNYCHID